MMQCILSTMSTYIAHDKVRLYHAIQRTWPMTRYVYTMQINVHGLIQGTLIYVVAGVDVVDSVFVVLCVAVVVIDDDVSGVVIDCVAVVVAVAVAIAVFVVGLLLLLLLWVV